MLCLVSLYLLMEKQELISKALQSKIPAEQWMIESRLESADDAEAYGNSIGCDLHTGLASENRSDAEKLKNLLLMGQFGLQTQGETVIDENPQRFG